MSTVCQNLEIPPYVTMKGIREGHEMAMEVCARESEAQNRHTMNSGADVRRSHRGRECDHVTWLHKVNEITRQEMGHGRRDFSKQP